MTQNQGTYDKIEKQFFGDEYKVEARESEIEPYRKILKAYTQYKILKQENTPKKRPRTEFDWTGSDEELDTSPEPM